MNLSRRALLLVLAAIAAGSSPAAFADPGLADYDLVFEDDFDGTELDASKWYTGLLWGPYLPINNEQQMYVDTLGMHSGFEHSPFLVSDSTLKITATPTDATLQPPPRPAETDPAWKPNRHAEYVYNHPDPAQNRPGYDPGNVDYLSGVITSYGSFKMTHGYVEARVKLPAGQGLWPAFWLLNQHYVESSPEIDVMEFLGQNTDEVYQTYHYFEPRNNWRKISSDTFVVKGAGWPQDWTEDFHVFGLAWSPRELVWYVDGVETNRLTDQDVDTDTGALFRISGQSMYLIANLAVGGNWPGAPDATTPFPATYEIDYIRAYEKRKSANLNLERDYQLMFHDEFEGDTLDASKWNTHFLWGPWLTINDEEQYYVDALGADSDKGYSPFSLENGILSINAQASSESPPALPPASLPAAGDRVWSDYPTFRREIDDAPIEYTSPDYTSGMITSYDAFKFVNGYAEIRARIPSGDGLWPAFWLLNGYYVGDLPEIDILEVRGENPQRAIHTYHWSDPETGAQQQSFETVRQASASGFADDFHTFGVRWQPGRLDWYVDGVLEHTHEDPLVAYQVMYVIANLAVGGNFNFAETDPEALPASLDIDYIRVYQEKDTPRYVPPSPVPEGEACDLEANRFTLPNNEWHMLGLPCSPPADSSTVSDLFGDDIDGDYATDWVVFTYDPTIPPPASPYVDPGVDGELAPGTGFWIIHRTGTTVALDLPDGSTRTFASVPATEPACVGPAACAATPLGNPGTTGVSWNMVGNPFAHDQQVAFDDLRLTVSSGACADGCSVPNARAEDLMREGFFHYDGTAYEPLISDGALLDAWKSYWVPMLPGAQGKAPVLIWSEQ